MWQQQSLAQVSLTPTPRVRGEQCCFCEPPPWAGIPWKSSSFHAGHTPDCLRGFMVLNWSNTALTLVCCSPGQPSINLHFKAWPCEGGSRKNRTLPHGFFSLQYHVYSETFIAAQQSKNMLHENCTGKCRILGELGECADKNQNGIASFKICHWKQRRE